MKVGDNISIVMKHFDFDLQKEFVEEYNGDLSVVEQIMNGWIIKSDCYDGGWDGDPDDAVVYLWDDRKKSASDEGIEWEWTWHDGHQGHGTTNVKVIYKY